MKVKEGKEQEYEKYKKVNSADPYSNRVVTYGEEWADMMEEYIKVNNSLSHEQAEECSHEADYDGITGFMYGAAKQALINFWEYGKELEELLGNGNPAVIELRDS